MVVGEIQSGAGAGGLELDGGHLQGVWVVHWEMKAEKGRDYVHSTLLDILLCTSAA